MSVSRSRITLRQSVAFVWRSLRSMRTALILLFLIAAGAIAGSLVPQIGVSNQRIQQMYATHPLLSSIYQHIGLFDVFGSWWFTLIYSLLMVSLAACLIPRTRAMLRNMRARPQPARELDAMRHYAERTVAADPAGAIASARRVLRRRMFRLSARNGTEQVAGEKGLAREAGSLLFHWAFFLILVGLAYGKGTGFTGQAVIVAGGPTWIEAHANYDGNIREGVFFNEAHTGVGVRVLSFNVEYRTDGSIADYVTRAQLLNPDGSVARSADIRVNHPASIDGVNFFQFGYGWAPVVDAWSGNSQIASSALTFQQMPTPPGVSPAAVPSIGVLKFPELNPQVGITFELWPDGRALLASGVTGRQIPMLRANHPILVYTMYQGDLGPSLEMPQNVLLTSTMKQVATGWLPEGGTATLPGGLKVGFPSLGQYTVLQVSRDRGTPIMLAAAILILLGLIPALYSSRRKVWVNAEANGSGTMLRIGGFALQRRAQFEEEFSRLVDEIARAEGRKR